MILIVLGILLIVIVILITKKGPVVTGLINYYYQFKYNRTNIFSNEKYNKSVNQNKRYLAIGFDDFRNSDFAFIIPLFKKYNATATFNRISKNTKLDKYDIAKINGVLANGNELGDHTWFHCNYIFSDPLINGQDSNNIEGNQKPFPSNNQLTKDRGDGKNVFGFDLNDNVGEFLEEYNEHCYKWSSFNNTWKNLSDDECQEIRNFYSIYRDDIGFLDTFDFLSNKYLGTKGKSKGSWNNEKNCYTGGIFTGCKTSCNHEIWERILQITKLFYQDQYNKEFSFDTWSYPGAKRSPFHFVKGDKVYYDQKYTKQYNYLAQFKSSLTSTSRSWTQCLRNAGYKIVHDSLCPAVFDGFEKPVMSKQFIYNARYSKIDGLTYRSNNSIWNVDIDNYNPVRYLFSFKKSIARQMYEDKSAFYQFVEEIRHNSASGMIHEEILDSNFKISQILFFIEVLKYCKKTGIEIISKKKAYDICFNNLVEKGNLIYNQKFVNSVKEFIKEADNMPNNPDGYIGDCYVVNNESSINTLVTNNTTYYVHYGIPIGEIEYSLIAKGKGSINIYEIKNKNSISLNNSELVKLSTIKINSDKNKSYKTTFSISNNKKTKYDQMFEGLGNKVAGIKIEYSKGLEINDVCLIKIN